MKNSTESVKREKQEWSFSESRTPFKWWIYTDGGNTIIEDGLSYYQAKGLTEAHNATLSPSAETREAARTKEATGPMELGECPFCGNDNIRYKQSPEFPFLWCSRCGGAMIAAEESWLAERWNKRNAPSAEQEGREA